MDNRIRLLLTSDNTLQFELPVDQLATIARILTKNGFQISLESAEIPKSPSERIREGVNSLLTDPRGAPAKYGAAHRRRMAITDELVDYLADIPPERRGRNRNSIRMTYAEACDLISKTGLNTAAAFRKWGITDSRIHQWKKEGDKCGLSLASYLMYYKQFGLDPFNLIRPERKI